MFTDIVRDTVFTSPAANGSYEAKIFGDSYNGDVSFVSTLRALLAERIGENELYFSVSRWAVSSGLSSVTDEELLSAVQSKFDFDGNSFRVWWLSGGDRSLLDRVYAMTSERLASDGEWTKLDAITDFFRKAFGVLCFIDEKRKRTLFVLKEYDMRRHHFLQMAALTAIPWYFSPSAGDRASHEEIALLNSLRENSPSAYLNALRVIAEKLDFEAAYFRKGLAEIDTVYERDRLQALKQEIEANLRTVSECQQRINNALTANYSKNIELIGLEAKLRDGGGESVLISYFDCNRRIRIDDIRDTKIWFHVNDCFAYFDEEVADQYLQNPNSVFYSYCHGDKDAARRLAKAIFIDQSVRVRTCAAYTLDVRGAFTAESGYDFRGDASDRLPNPHINQYACLGNYQREINTKLRNRDFIGVLELAVASAKSIALTDATVIDRFFRELYAGENGRCFEADGRQMNLNEVLTYVKEAEIREGEE